MPNLRNILKLSADSLLKPLGYTISRNIGCDYINDIKRLMLPHDVKYIIDGGAYKGTYSIDMANLFPSALIYAFEPYPSSFNMLLNSVEKYQNVKPVNLALGSVSGKMAFYTNASPLTNSLAKISTQKSKEFNELVRPTGEIIVSVIDLAGFMDNERLPRVDMLKLDLQGYELEALKGLGIMLDKVKLIFMEIQFLQIYQDTPLFSDITYYLKKHGFSFFQFYDLVRSPDNGRLLYGDAIFLNDKYFSL